MATTTITVQEVRPQQPGKKTCVVVDVNGDNYYVWPNHAAMYQVGNAYDLAYTIRNFKGMNFRYVDNEPRPSAEPPQTRTPVQRPNGATAKTYAGGDHRDENIFVSMCIGRAIQAGLLDPHNTEATVVLGRAVRSAYPQIWAPLQVQRVAPRQAANGDMDDTIPF